jgi:hypothetical protein
MGNIHVQGDDIPGGAYNYAWSQPMPETKAQGQAGLAQVRAQCTPRQLKDRDDAFKRAAKFIDSTLTQAPPLVFRTFQNRDVADDPKRKTRRVDIEITRGTAFA